MPEKSNRIKLIAIFSIIALPAAVLLTSAWIFSVYSDVLKTSGQILLVIIFALFLIFVSGYLSFLYIFRKYLTPLKVLTQVLNDIKTHTFKPLAQGVNLEGFADIYKTLVSLETLFAQNYQYINNLKQIQKAEINLFETSISAINDPVILLNSKIEVKYINLAAENFTGIKKPDVTGKKIDQFVRFYEKNGKEILPAVYLPPRSDTQNPRVFFGSEIKIISAVNFQVFADISFFKPDFAELIDISGVILFHDKTKEKQLEAMKLDFVSMAAHELRTPLTSVKGYISVFLNENKNKLTLEQLMFIRRINTSTQQLSGLVENLLSVARVERGNLTLHSQIVDWVSNVGTQIDTFQHRADEKRIKLTFIKPEKPISKVDVDLIRINEVLNNLVSNALNYTEPMGKIMVWIDESNDRITTYFKDTGKGIPREAFSHLFSKFFRVQGGSAEQSSRGNGLGLYLSKAIVELHHGKIWAQSEGIGKGSVFAFSLPAVK
ncbi:hypothetical protein HYW44_00400, partial [Candidatus Daviesbacteria bacterium]|nr:hypothetical protein [Candidatus Daviesbacteria bacterium]